MAPHPAVVDLDQVPHPHEERGTRRRPAICSLAGKSSVPVRRTAERLRTARCAVAGAPILIGRTRRAGKAATRSRPPTASTLLGACAAAKLPADRPRVRPRRRHQSRCRRRMRSQKSLSRDRRCGRRWERMATWSC